jgi:hypothetical protein
MGGAGGGVDCAARNPAERTAAAAKAIISRLIFFTVTRACIVTFMVNRAPDIEYKIHLAPLSWAHYGCA